MMLPTQDKEARLQEKEMRRLAHEYFKNGHKASLQAGHWIGLVEYMCQAQLTKLEKLGYHKGLPSSIEEALNSGDGVYRP